MRSLFANTLEYYVKNFSASPSKDVKTSFIENLCCNIASYTIQLVTTGNPVNYYVTSIVDKTHHGPVIAPFSMKILKDLLQFLPTPDVF